MRSANVVVEIVIRDPEHLFPMGLRNCKHFLEQAFALELAIVRESRLVQLAGWLPL
jgi:hypothetical protein